MGRLLIFVNLRYKSGYIFLKHPDSKERMQIYIRIHAPERVPENIWII